jgi:hypothetical protein
MAAKPLALRRNGPPKTRLGSARGRGSFGAEKVSGTDRTNLMTLLRDRATASRKGAERSGRTTVCRYARRGGGSGHPYAIFDAARPLLALVQLMPAFTL